MSDCIRAWKGWRISLRIHLIYCFEYNLMDHWHFGEFRYDFFFEQSYSMIFISIWIVYRVAFLVYLLFFALLKLLKHLTYLISWMLFMCCMILLIFNQHVSDEWCYGCIIDSLSFSQCQTCRAFSHRTQSEWATAMLWLELGGFPWHHLLFTTSLSKICLVGTSASHSRDDTGIK